MAIATWIVPAGRYKLDKEGSPVPGTYHEVDSNQARVLVDSLTAPINGLYGIEDAKGKISYYNSGVLFGAIDVALFIIVSVGSSASRCAPAPSRPGSGVSSPACRDGNGG